MGGASFVCERCWLVFEGRGPKRCSDCKADAPEGGWSAMPYTYRRVYRFERQLGRGGMGAVFAARVVDEAEDEMPTEVAVKVMRRDVSASAGEAEALKRRFATEKRATALLGESERFVRVYLPASGHLVMERVAAPTLDRLRESETALTPIQVAQLGVEVLAGVEEMHRLHVVHRDLKPSNLFVEVREKGYGVKIADFGVCLIGPAGSTTLPGRRVGTPDYMSPEQVLDADRVGPSADLYAVASVLWEAIEGVVPFPLPAGPGELEDRVQARLQAQRQRPDRPKSLARYPKLYDVLVQALAWGPAVRFKTAREFAESLEAFVAQWEVETDQAERRAKENIAAMRQRIALLRRRIDLVKKLGADLEELAASLDAHGHRIDSGIGKQTIAGTVDDLVRLEARLALSEAKAAEVLTAWKEVTEKKKPDRGAGLPPARIASSVSAIPGPPSPPASAPAGGDGPSLRAVFRSLSDEQRAAFATAAVRVAEEGRDGGRQATEAKPPAKPLWNRYRSEDLIAVLTFGVLVSLGMWAYFDPMVNGSGAVSFVILAWFSAILLGAGLASAGAKFLPRWRDVDENLVMACVFVAVGTSPWWPGLAGAMRNWLQVDQLSVQRLWLSTALIVIVPTLLSCVVGLVAVEVVAWWRRRA